MILPLKGFIMGVAGIESLLFIMATMSTEVVVSLVGLGVVIIGAFVTIITLRMTLKNNLAVIAANQKTLQASQRDLEHNQTKLNTATEVLHNQINGHMTSLIAATKGQYQAEGELKGKADQKIIEHDIQSTKEAAVTTALNTPVPNGNSGSNTIVDKIDDIKEEQKQVMGDQKEVMTEQKDVIKDQKSGLI